MGLGEGVPVDLLGAKGARAGGRPKASATKGPEMKLREGGVCAGFPAAWRATVIKTPLGTKVCVPEAMLAAKGLISA